MSLIEHNQNLSVTLSDEEARVIESLVTRGLSEEQALSLTGTNRLAWVNHVAVKVSDDVEWLKRLTSKGAHYIGALSVQRVVEHLESETCDPRFALDVLSRRDPTWSTKATVQVTMPTPILDIAAVKAQAVLEGEKVTKMIGEGEGAS